jgi:predicted O-methyltransferase YrrM
MNDEVVEYIRALVPARDELLTQMEHTAERDAIPILDLDTMQLFRVLLASLQPATILEVGTAIGYSATVMARACGASIVTIERNPERAAQARANIRKAGLEQRVTLYEGDAFDILPTLQGPFDMVFLDAAKGQYPNFLEVVLPLLRDGGVLLSDNIFFQGLVTGPDFVKHKLRTMVTRLREYNQILASHPQLKTAFVPVGDGLAISLKSGREQLNKIK